MGEKRNIWAFWDFWDSGQMRALRLSQRRRFDTISPIGGITQRPVR